ncbi:MAG: hypothetical protein JJ974_10600 [Phycisphaerales bacterium]|nr:hypothetical protein [Phycisphaerales bacterium]
MLPPIPPFEAYHPLVVHFPIAMLLSAWLPLILGFFLKGHKEHQDSTKYWWIATLLWVGIGVTGVMASVSTGDAAEEIAIVTTDAAKSVLEEHERTAIYTRILSIITFLALLSAFILRYTINAKKPVVIIAIAITALFYAATTIFLINTAHQGGLLVHQHGIHAPIPD